MAQIDFTRIRSNIAALNSLNSLNNVNRNLAIAQTRLATGKRINDAADDPAGIAIATQLDARRNGLQVARDIVGEAKNMLAVAEGGVHKIEEMLVQIRNKTLAAASDNTGSDQRTALASEVSQLLSEIDDTVNQTKWNGRTMFTTANYTATFQTGADANESTSVQFTQSSALSSSGLGLGSFSTNTASGTFASVSSANAFLAAVNTAIDTISETLGRLGAYSARLNFKEEILSISHVNTEAAYNRIMNADMAAEQVNATKYTVLQQTAVAMLAQANMSPQAILSLFR